MNEIKRSRNVIDINQENCKLFLLEYEAFIAREKLGIQIVYTMQ